MLYEDGHNSQQSHDNGEKRLFYRGRRRSRGQSLFVLEAWRKQFDYQWTHTLFQHEAEFLVLSGKRCVCGEEVGEGRGRVGGEDVIKNMSIELWRE